MYFIFDFDGTLTPSSYPKYPIIQKCGYLEEEFYQLVFRRVQKEKKNLYQAFFEVFQEILKKAGLEVSMSNISYKAEDTVFNPGVEDFFKFIKDWKVKNYVITSGYEEFVKNTAIAAYFEKIIGTQVDDEGNITRIITDELKVQVIQELIKEDNIYPQDIVYIGDGLTDKYAMKYVKDNGGVCIFVYDLDKDKDREVLKQLLEMGVIDKAFKRDYKEDGELFQYIKSLYIKRGFGNG